MTENFPAKGETATNEYAVQVIATIQTDFDSKFGIPRQSGIVDSSIGVIRFEPAYRSPEALRGLSGFSHLWLIWLFSENMGKGWSPTVRPPKLGGNTRMGVFATRSPFRPNPIGLSSVRLLEIQTDGKDTPRLIVSGADLMNGTPIIDIKPYVPYTDLHPEALGGFALPGNAHRLQVDFPPKLLAKVPQEKQSALMETLAQDPRPGYVEDAGRIFGLSFAGMEVRFSVEGDRLQVVEIQPGFIRREGS